VTDLVGSALPVDFGGTVLVNPSARQVVDQAASAGLTVSNHLTTRWRPWG